MQQNHFHRLLKTFLINVSFVAMVSYPLLSRAPLALYSLRKQSIIETELIWELIFSGPGRVN